jgi:hypothetical protein
MLCCPIACAHEKAATKKNCSSPEGRNRKKSVAGPPYVSYMDVYTRVSF